MRRYIISRLVRSLVSIGVVVAIVFILIFTLVPRDNIFYQDAVYLRLSTAEKKTNYRYTKYQQFGYLKYVKYTEYSSKTPGATYQSFIDYYTSQGYEIDFLDKNKSNSQPLAYKNKSPIILMFNWFGNLLEFDGINKAQDPDNPDLERKLYIGKDWEGTPALMCSGCDYKYQLYFDEKFPFIHTNWVKLDLGVSYPTNANRDITDVISNRQGSLATRTVEFPTGYVGKSAIEEHSLRYKLVENRSYVDERYFVDNYGVFSENYTDPSMLGVSFLIGVIATILSYIIGLPIGMWMANRKGKLVDKIGIIYIVFISSVPSLAYIYMFKALGVSMGLPGVFPTYGAHNVLSYVLPVLSLALPSVGGLMMWMRRYMIDQASSDYVKFARSKGLSEREIFSSHIMRNAVVPLSQRVPLAIVASLTGAIITESVYAVGGMGKMLTTSIQAYDNTLIIALTFFYTAISVFGLFLGDLVMAVVDPRISFATKGGRK